MTIELKIFEDTGPISSGRGTTITEVTNVNWKRTGDVTQAYYFYPLRRPLDEGDQTFSYKKYTSFRIGGTYNRIKNVKIKLSVNEAEQATGCQLFYKLTNVYEEPTNTYDGSMIWTGDTDIEFNPMTSTVGPHDATTRPIVHGPDEVFYTMYLVTQMRVNAAEWDDVGNTKQFKVLLTAYEFE